MRYRGSTVTCSTAVHIVVGQTRKGRGWWLDNGVRMWRCIAQQVTCIALMDRAQHVRLRL